MGEGATLQDFLLKSLVSYLADHIYESGQFSQKSWGSEGAGHFLVN